MELNSFIHFQSYQNFISCSNELENLYRKYCSAEIPYNQNDFSTVFFECFDYLSSLKKEDIEVLKSNVELHSKILMFNAIKLNLIALNPALLKIPGFKKSF